MSGGSAFTSEEGSVTYGEVVEHASLLLEGLESISSTDPQSGLAQNLLGSSHSPLLHSKHRRVFVNLLFKTLRK